MARVKKQAPPVEETLSDAVEYQEIVDAESARAALREKLGIESEIESTIHVYLIDAESKMDFKIWQGDADSYDLEALAKRHGSGVYRVKAYARNAEGYKPLVYNILQPWRLMPEDEAKVTAAREAAKNPPSPQAMPDVQGMLGVLRLEIAALRESPKIDPFAQMQQLAVLMKTLMPAPVAAVVPGPDLPAMLGMLKTLKDLTGGDVSPDASASERLLLKAADALFPAIAQGMQQGQTVPQPEPIADAAPAILPAPSADTMTDEEKEMRIMQELKLQAFKLQLIGANKAAVRGVAADVYAETIYDLFDDADIQQLAMRVDWLDIIVGVVPDCATHKAWYEAMRARLTQMAVEDELLVRNAAGALTVPVESDITDIDQSTGAIDGGIAIRATGTSE